MGATEGPGRIERQMPAWDIVSSFDPKTWLVWENFSEADFTIARGLRTGISAGIEGTVRRTVPDLTLPDGALIRNARLLATREHEWTHYRQHISTRYGLLLEKLTSARERHYVDYLERLGRSRDIGARELDVLTVVRSPGLQNFSDEVRVRAFACHVLDTLGDLLWKTTASGDQLRELLNFADRIWDNYLDAKPVGLRIQTRLGPDDQSCGNGSLTGESVVEGLARFRELQELSVHFREDAPKYWDQMPHTIGDYAIDYLCRLLRVAPSHPLVGALLDCAVSNMPDPEVCEGSFLFEEIHPGRRIMSIQAILETRARTLRSVTYHTAHDVACELLDIEPKALAQSYASAAARLRTSLERAHSNASSDDVTIAFPAAYQAAILTAYENGFSLRAQAPYIFAFPQRSFTMGDSEAWNNFVNFTRPLMSMTDDGFVIREDIVRQHPLTPVALLTSTTVSFIYIDVQHGQELIRTKKFLRSLLRTQGAEMLNVLSSFVNLSLPIALRPLASNAFERIK